MQQNDDTVACWAECWNAAAQNMDTLTDTSLAGIWNKRSDRFARDMSGEKRQKRMDDVLGLLAEAGFSPEGARILDIGCGPGTLALPLARAGAEVTALDISTAMLDRIRDAAAEEDLSIAPMECSWWTADIDRLGFRNRFDLVIASMTPGVRDQETFDRMTACSREYCYYSNFVKRSNDGIYRDIYRNILGETPRENAHGPGLLYPFMYLYTRGYRPLVKFSHMKGNPERDWEEAAEKAIDFLGGTRSFTDETREKIRAYYENAAKNGTFGSDSGTFIGMMAWTVQER